MHKIFLLLLLLGIAKLVFAQPLPVPKTNPQKVLVHYMPWFETPATNSGNWGLHWTMANKNPNIIINAATGQRQIAAQYYPLIGPYASSDPAVMEYHLLLMKYCGIDGLLIDFYGNGGNDLPLLLRNTNALVPNIAKAGLTFGVVFEDQFAATLAAARANMGYVGTNYLPLPHYQKIKNAPLIGVFGPQKYQTQANWTRILDTLGTNPEFLTLWYQSNQPGTNADGEFSWVYSDSTAGLSNFYRNRITSLKTSIGSAWPGFEPYYTKGGWGGPTWTIKPKNGQTLSQTLALGKQYAGKLDALQLVTWNDFGEGTMLEPTLETGYTYLQQIQTHTGVAYTVAELELIHRLYLLRKRFLAQPAPQRALDSVYASFVRLDVSRAKIVLDSLEATSLATQTKQSPPFTLSPNPATDVIHLSGPLADGSIVVYDAMGRLVRHLPATAALFVADLPKGIYQLRLVTAGAAFTQKFVKE